MSRFRLFYRLILRPMLAEPMRTALMIFAVALGVAVVLAIDLAGEAAAGSFHSSIETLAGDSNLEVVAAGGVPEEIAGKLATLAYPIRVRPRIEDSATVVSSGETLPLIGVDFIAESNDRQINDRQINGGEPGGNSAQSFPDAASADEVLKHLDGSYVNDGRSVWVGSRLGRKPGQALRLLVNDEEHDYTVRGVFDDSKEGSSAILMDIAAAQRELRKAGRVDRILVKVPGEPSLAEWQKTLSATLPPGVEVRPQGSGTDENRHMLAAFRSNLQVLSYVSLVVGAFLIYNTISVSVVRRLSEIGIVRALGASRGAVMGAFLGEAVLLGLAGAVVALPLGRLMASGAVRLLGATVDALYISSRPGSIDLTWISVVLAVALGVTMAVVSALAPAREASLVSPVEAMARGRREFDSRVHKFRDLWIAVAFAAAGAAASQMPPLFGRPLFGYLSALLLIGALVMAVPAVIIGLTSVSSGLLRKVAGAEGLLASRSLAGSLRRTSVLVGALATAVAMMVSVGIMVGSFRQTVLVWMNDQLPADLYLRPAGDPAAARHPTIAPDLADRLAKLPGVAAVDRFRAYEISYQNLPVTLASADLRVMQNFRSTDFLSRRNAAAVLAELRGADTVIVSEPFANKHHVRAGESLMLALGARKAPFRVVDVYYDYGTEHGVIIMDRDTMLKYLPDPVPTNLAVYVTPGADLDHVRDEITHAAAGSRVLVFTNRDLRTEAIRIFDQTFAITYALEIVAIFVAVMGIAGALIALVIDRRREFGLLRFLGAATWQIRKLILVEAGIIGLLANAAGFGLGAVLSLVLIFVINKQSFGWTIQFHWPVAVLVGALTGVSLASVLAGLYPARVAVRLPPIEVVHED